MDDAVEPDFDEDGRPLVSRSRDTSKELRAPRGLLASVLSPFAWWSDIAVRTLVLVNVAAVVERADEALLPAVYREIGEAFHASPSALGAISLARALCQALSFPLAALLVLLMPRVSIVALGALVWGVATAGVGLSNSYLQVALWRGLNGLGLALVIPAIQSLVADSAAEGHRGMAFGWLQFVTNWGNILGGVLGVSLAGTHVLGVSGWRVAFFLVALVSIGLAAVIHGCAADPPSRAEAALHRPLSPDSSDDAGSPSIHDVELSHEPSLRLWAKGPLSPVRGEGAEGRQEKGEGRWDTAEGVKAPMSTGEVWLGALKGAVADTWRVLQVPSFCIIVLQGVVGSFAWGAFSFSAMWLELVGFSHGVTAALLTAFAVSMCLGGLFGGWLGDRMAKSFPNSGRIIVAQISSGTAVLCSFLVLRVLPPDPTWWLSHALALSGMGFLISWNASATNNPIFAEIVPEKSRTNVYALDRAFEVAFAAFAPLTVGFLAEHLFGYNPSGSGESTPGSHRDTGNANALAGGLFLAMAVPFALCCCVYGFLYRTYPRDRDQVRAEMRVEVEGLRTMVSERVVLLKVNSDEHQ